MTQRAEVMSTGPPDAASGTTTPRAGKLLLWLAFSIPRARSGRSVEPSFAAEDAAYAGLPPLQLLPARLRRLTAGW